MKCHICNYWTPEQGCAHYEAAEPYKTLVPKIISFVYKDSNNISEINDFKIGICAAIKYLMAKNKILLP